MTYYVIEHPTRGWYTGSELENPHFAWSILASDERVHKMFSLKEVQIELDKMPGKIAGKCNVKKLKI